MVRPTVFVNMSASYSLVSIWNICISFSFTSHWKWWYLIVICLVLGKNLSSNNCNTAIFIFKYFTVKIGSVRFNGNTSLMSLNWFINGTISFIAWLNPIYSAAVVDRAISNRNFEHYRTG